MPTNKGANSYKINISKIGIRSYEIKALLAQLTI